MNNESLVQAVRVLNQGGVIIFPTDTAFGIGCRMDNIAAVERLFEIRQRPLTQTPPILISSIEKSKEYAQVSEKVENDLLRVYWPGALTVIMPVKENINPLLHKDTGIGLRMPNHEQVLALLAAVEVGILGPSANFHGNSTPYLFSLLDPELVRKVDYVLEGECTLQKESTVISCLQSPWSIVRQGAVVLPL